jgi:hypothetical protein
LTNNKAILPECVTQLFQELSAPSLTELHLSACDISTSTGSDIAQYLQSARSRNIEILELNGNHLGSTGVREIVDAVELSNFGLLQLGVLANDLPVPPISETDDHSLSVTESIHAETRALHHEVHDRLPPLLQRNRALTRRIRNATIRTIPAARIVLNAQPVSDEDMAKSIIDQVASLSISNPSAPVKRPFPILDLPREVIYLIVRHCSGDAYAFSESQFSRLRVEAEDREALKKLARATQPRSEGTEDKLEREMSKRQVRDEWLKRGKWDKWEVNRFHAS